MSLPHHLIIFARTPRLGQGKTRLAADIGSVAATAFQRRTIKGLLARLGGDRRWHCRLAVTPDRDAHNPGLWHALPAHRRLPDIVPQGRGDLGQRMTRALRHPPPGPAVLIGTDVPAIRPHHIAAAFRLLGRCDVVFGPATDGGFWLVGLRRRPRLPDIFGGVPWSDPRTLERTLANLGPGMRVGFLETLDDIDDGAAYARARPDVP